MYTKVYETIPGMHMGILKNNPGNGDSAKSVAFDEHFTRNSMMLKYSDDLKDDLKKIEEMDNG